MLQLMHRVKPRHIRTICFYGALIAAPLCAILALMAIPQALYHSPADQLHGELVRILYIHVPSAYLSVNIYLMMAIAALFALTFKSTIADMILHAIAPIGLVFTMLTLISGSIWGKPSWGSYWVWDARLTSVLVLFFLYIGYFSIRRGFTSIQHGRIASQILVFAGVINLPIVKFSVDWWNSLHQPASIFRLGGSKIAPEMMQPLLLMMAACTAFYLLLSFLRILTMMDAHYLERREA